MARVCGSLAALTTLAGLVACSGGASTLPSGTPVEVSFVVEGGIAGIQERLEVSRDGALSLLRDGRPAGEGRLEAESLRRLHDLVACPAFRALAPRYLPANPCCDRFTYTVSVARPEGTQSVTTMDGVTWPRPLAEAIALLQRAKAQVAKAGTTASS
jgi:hypothetical protein